MRIEKYKSLHFFSRRHCLIASTGFLNKRRFPRSRMSIQTTSSLHTMIVTAHITTIRGLNPLISRPTRLLSIPNYPLSKLFKSLCADSTGCIDRPVVKLSIINPSPSSPRAPPGKSLAYNHKRSEISQSVLDNFRLMDDGPRLDEDH